MPHALHDFEPGSGQGGQRRDRVRRRDYPIELSPDDEHGSFELAEAISEDEVLTVPGERARCDRFHRVVGAWRVAGRVHVVDAAFEDKSPVLEKKLQQPPRLFARRRGFDPVEQFAVDLRPESRTIDQRQRADEFRPVERELQCRCTTKRVADQDSRRKLQLLEKLADLGGQSRDRVVGRLWRRFVAGAVAGKVDGDDAVSLRESAEHAAPG